MLGLALAIGSLFTTGATAAYLAGASMLVGVYTAREQRKKAQRALERSVKDRTIMVRDAVADRPYLFGRVRTSGQIQFPGTSGASSELLHWCLALGDQIDAVEDVWFGDQSIGTRGADGWVTNGRFFKARTEPTFEYLIVSAGATVTLLRGSNEWATLTSVARPATGDSGETILYVGNPATDANAYSSAYGAGNKIVLTFHAALVGSPVTISYTYMTGESKARAKAFLGAPGQAADPYLIAQLPTAWSATDKFTGTSYISGTNAYDNDLYPTGIEEVSAIVRGALCYDPRTTTTAWTCNPALIAWKWISQHYPNETYDSASLIAAANVCDEDVALAGVETQDRYTFDDVISSDTSVVDGLERILQSMVGSACRVAGTWYIWAGAWEEPSLALDETDLAPGEITIQGVAEDGVLFNGIGGRYTDAARWVEDSFPTYVSPAYVGLDDGEEEVLDVDLTMITDVHRAQRVARLMLHKARQALTFACSCEMSAQALYPGRVVTWTIEKYGWDEKPFRCLRRVYQPSTGTLLCVFQEDAEAIYSSTFSELTTPDPAPNTNLPDPLTVEAPVLTFASGAQYVQVLADGSQRPYLRVYWQQMDESVESVEIWWRRPGETTWQQGIVDASAQVFDAYGISRSETYIVQGRAINGIGVRSAWTSTVTTTNGDVPINYIGPGMVGTPQIQASAATDVYLYGYSGPAISLEYASGSGTGGTELLDRILVSNDSDEAVTVILTATANYQISGKGLGCHFAIDQQFNSNEVVIDMEVPTWNWINAATNRLWPAIDSASEQVIYRHMMVTTTLTLEAGEACGLTLAGRVSDAYVSGVVFNYAYSTDQTLRVEIIKR